ncbi:hypothetical protein EQ856_00350 [Enterococcus hirae]|nr:hypothetical protein A6J73_02540 [Enterococcus hirae]KAB5915706.1 hypothetical protein GA614_09895 [Bifidobacterium adolescentis]HCE20610.1 hypothetical protein [Enterococcus sp.]MBO1088358.1 hypothetical protein [Enterococcus hirae]MBO1091086.1 hypothetical protein [Enterococcus hirae]
MKRHLHITPSYDMLFWYELNYSIAPNRGKGGKLHGKSLLLYWSQDKKWKQSFSCDELNKTYC